MKVIFRNKFFYAMLLFLLGYNTVEAQTNDPSRYANESVLANGTWYKIKVEDTGVYKITYEKLKQWGIANPQNVQIYGYGGWMIDQDFASTDQLASQDDLPKVGMWMSKPRDQFGPGDYILFYAKGDVKWTYTSGSFRQTQNPYSFDSYYFITETTGDSKLMAEATAASTVDEVLTTYNDYYLHEQELVNITQTGREFYGENFKTKPNQDFSVSLSGITSDPASVSISFIARTTASTATISTSVNGTEIDKGSIPVIDDSYYARASLYETTKTSTLQDNNVVSLSYKQGTSSDDNVHLNYFRINYTRKLQPYGAVTLFRSAQTGKSLEFQIANASNNLLVFDVTNGETPAIVKTSLSGSSMSFRASNSQIREYAMVDISKTLPEPIMVEQVVNQNLHALEAKEMVIIVRPFLRKYAEEYAQIHKDDSGLESLIVNAEDVYNEFSSGKPDVTAYRKLMKMFYDRSVANGKTPPQYLLLFGDGSYDNRFIMSSNWTVANDKKAMLLTYQTPLNSVHEEYSYTTDDYLGFLDSATGNDGGRDNLMGRYKLDIGIGRFPVRTEKEASTIISKIKNYIADKDKGIWKNNLGFIADDLVTGLTYAPANEDDHFINSEHYTDTIQKYYPDFMINKIYLDTYPREITANGGRYPDAQKVMFDKLNSGLLLLNYVGHGGTASWTHEYLLTMQDVEGLSNKRLPLLITATCDFGRWDANDISGGEKFLLNTKGGAIALFTTARVVYGGSNHRLATEIFKHIFDKKDGQPMRLGDIMRLAKAGLTNDTNKLRFTLLGDPALRLSYPDGDYKVNVTEINGTNASSSTPIQIKALANNVIKGELVDKSGNLLSDFNGYLDAVIFDSRQSLKTRGNMRDGSFDTDYQLDYQDYINQIYSGRVRVENGKYTIEFTTPKDILYSTDFGKMSFYAFSDDDKYEAQGSFFNYNVNGIDDNGGSTSVPRIDKIYLNRPDFASGGKVNSTPYFYAEVSDDTGINIANGIGHNISVTVDGSLNYDLTSSFAGEEGSLKKGSVGYVLPELSEGKHHLLFRVWNVYNNSAIAELDFEVVNDYKPVIYDFNILGNPASYTTGTKFEFVTDVVGSKVDVRYYVYSLTGALLWQHEELDTTDFTYEWDLKMNSGSPLEAGVYICRMTVSVDGGVKASKSKKLVVTKQ